MGREIKRVALDFDWPMKKIWQGFINPHFVPCPNPGCHGGATTAEKWVFSLCRLLAMMGEESIQAGRPMHPYLCRLPHIPTKGERLPDGEYEIVPPTPAVRDFVLKLAAYGRHAPRKHDRPIEDDYNREHDIYRALLRATELPEDWGTCKTCDGDNLNPAVKDAYEAWTTTEPPAGPGWQVWETVSEGSPVSPVFPERGALVEWLVKQGYSRKAADAFAVDGGSVPSMMIADGKLYSNIEIAGKE
jgi:hypothetical protein